MVVLGIGIGFFCGVLLMHLLAAARIGRSFAPPAPALRAAWPQLAGRTTGVPGLNAVNVARRMKKPMSCKSDKEYADLYLGGQIQEAACMAHARRKLHDLHAVRPSPITNQALERIGALYRIEEHIRGKPPEERRRVHQTRAVPPLDDMKRWFEATLLTLSAKSDTIKAIQYSLNRWPALVYYCRDGQAEIDNLIAGRALRGAAIGRRNYLFAGADSGGEWAAAMYSLIGPARLNGIDPEAYLHYVIERSADHPVNRIDDLLPWNVAPLLPQPPLALIPSASSRSPVGQGHPRRYCSIADGSTSGTSTTASVSRPTRSRANAAAA